MQFDVYIWNIKTQLKPIGLLDIVILCSEHIDCLLFVFVWTFQLYIYFMNGSNIISIYNYFDQWAPLSWSQEPTSPNWSKYLEHGNEENSET